VKARDIVLRPLVTVGPRDFARHAQGLMDDFGQTMLPVVDEAVFLGVVTRNRCLRGKPGVAAPHVQEVMTQPELTAGLDMDLGDLYDAMTAFEVLCVPVLDDGHVVGVVTRSDVLRALSHDDPHLRVGHAAHDG
jgi:CBS domain-containing protein